MPDAVYISLPLFLLALLTEFDLNPQIILVSIFSAHHALSKTFHPALIQPSKFRTSQSQPCQTLLGPLSPKDDFGGRFSTGNKSTEK